MEENKDQPTINPVVETPDTTKTDDKGGNGDDKTPKTFTQDDLDKILSDRLSREREKDKAEREKAISDAIAEEKRLSKLTQEQKEKELVTKQAQEIAKREKDLILRENKLEAISKLDESKISIKFVDFVLSDDKEEMHNRIENLKSVWDKALHEEVARQLKGESPRDVNVSNSNAVPKAPATVL